jgi:hypothetical protein
VNADFDYLGDLRRSKGPDALEARRYLPREHVE